MAGDGPGGDVDHARVQLAGDLEHLRQHQQEPLARREGRRERAALEGAVHGSRSAGLRLHLDDLRHMSPEVRLARRRPGVGQLPHRARGRDRIDRDQVGQTVRDAGGGLVAVDDDALRFGEPTHALTLEALEPAHLRRNALTVPGELRQQQRWHPPYPSSKSRVWAAITSSSPAGTTTASKCAEKPDALDDPRLVARPRVRRSLR